MANEKKPIFADGLRMRQEMIDRIGKDIKDAPPPRRPSMFEGINPFALLSIACFVGLFLLLIGGV